MDYESPAGGNPESAAGYTASEAPSTSDRPPLVSEIQLRNLLSFGPDSPSVPLGELNVLIGSNGSGKSNFLQAFRVLKHLHADVEQPFRQDGFSSWVWSHVADRDRRSAGVRSASARSSKNARMAQPSSITLDVMLNYLAPDSPIKSTWDYHVELTKNGHQGIRIRSESLSRHENESDLAHVRTARSAHKRPCHKRASRTNASGKPRTPAGPSDQSQLESLLADIQMYELAGDHQFATPLSSQAADRTNTMRLREDFSNLAAVLQRISQQSERRDQLNRNLRSFFFADNYEVVERDGSVEVLIHERGKLISASRTSHGALRYLALLAILCDPDPPPIICIEQPEVGIQMTYIPELVDLMHQASRRSQLVVTTYSSDLLDCLSDYPEVVLVSEREYGQTYLERLNLKELNRLKRLTKRKSLAWHWKVGHLGGTW